MARVSPDEFAEKWARRTAGAVNDLRAGVQKVTEAPTAKAAEKADKMLQKVQAAVQEGRWQANLKKVSLEEWRKKMLDKGVPRVAQGVEAAREKSRAFAEQLLPHIDAAVAEVKRLPDLTLEDSINRVATFIRRMSEFKKR